MNSVASSAVLGLVPVPPTAPYATPNRKERHAARRPDEVLQRQPHCFVEGATIAPSVDGEVVLKEEQP
jgi:hypothetical protein